MLIRFAAGSPGFAIVFLRTRTARRKLSRSVVVSRVALFLILIITPPPAYRENMSRVADDPLTPSALLRQTDYSYRCSIATSADAHQRPLHRYLDYPVHAGVDVAVVVDVAHGCDLDLVLPGGPRRRGAEGVGAQGLRASGVAGDRMCHAVVVCPAHDIVHL